jgi:16S rRNA processing protein RimM
VPAKSSSSSGQPPFLLLGRVLRPHGIRGELRIEVLTAYPERIVSGSKVYIGPDADDVSSAVLHEVTGARKHQGYLILQLEDFVDRNEADILRDQYVMIALEDAVPLEEGEFYLYQVIGLSVYTVDGDFLGEVSDVIETGANDVYVVQGPRGEVLLPATEECVVDIDIDAQKMTVQLMEGLLGD